MTLLTEKDVKHDDVDTVANAALVVSLLYQSLCFSFTNENSINEVVFNGHS